MDYKWIGLEQKWIGSRKLDFLPTPSCIDILLYHTLISFYLNLYFN